MIVGSFATATCTRCKKKVQAEEIRNDIFAQKIPVCTTCSKNNLPPINPSPDSEYKGKFLLRHYPKMAKVFSFFKSHD